MVLTNGSKQTWTCFQSFLPEGVVEWGKGVRVSYSVLCAQVLPLQTTGLWMYWKCWPVQQFVTKYRVAWAKIPPQKLAYLLTIFYFYYYYCKCTAFYHGSVFWCKWTYFKADRWGSSPYRSTVQNLWSDLISEL